jgi:hypothetical protein
MMLWGVMRPQTGVVRSRNRLFPCHFVDSEVHPLNKRTIDLLYQGYETELGGLSIYETAITCAVNKDLKKEWKEYLGQTKNHVRLMRDALKALDLNPKKETPGRKVVHHIGRALVKAMKMARASGDKEAAELVAAECVVLAETKDHLNWELVGELAKSMAGAKGKALKFAHGEVEDEEDEHLYHTTGWTRELWLRSLDLPAVLPPPEERKEVKTAIGAARAKQARHPRRLPAKEARPAK